MRERKPKMDYMDDGKLDDKRIEQMKLLKSFEDKSYKLAKAEHDFKGHSTGVKIGGRNISKRYDEFKAEYEKNLSDVMMTLYQLNKKKEEFSAGERSFIENLVEKYKKYDNIGLFD